ncbi:MAG: SDR family NAD(P)-dependent oxidoreductase [Pseudomonadota bacterium]
MAGKKLQDKIALITGASQGIGAAVARAYARQGAHVILVARNQKNLEKIDDEIQAEGGKAALLPLDLQDFDAIKKIGPSIAEKFGKLDIFVGNAGLAGTLMPLAQISDTEFNRILDVNLKANFHLLKTLDPLLQASEAGRVILVSTGQAVTKGRAYWGTYAISKAALETMAQVYADEVRQTNTKVNLIDPDVVRTDMRASVKPGEDPMSIPSPDDVTPYFIDLAAPDCTQHGEIIRIDSNEIRKGESHAA